MSLNDAQLIAFGRIVSEEICLREFSEWRNFRGVLENLGRFFFGGGEIVRRNSVNLRMSGGSFGRNFLLMSFSFRRFPTL